MEENLFYLFSFSALLFVSSGEGGEERLCLVGGKGLNWAYAFANLLISNATIVLYLPITDAFDRKFPYSIINCWC